MDCELIISAERKAVELEISGDAQLHEKNAEVIAANAALDECVHGEVTGATYAENVAQAVSVIEDVGAAIAEKGLAVPDVPGAYGDIIRNELSAGADINPAWTNWLYAYAYNRTDFLNKLKYSDTRNGVDFSNMFRESTTLTTIPPFDTSNGVNFRNMFYSDRMLLTIPLLNVSKGTDCNAMFTGCTKLENITFEGEIPISISFAQSPLSLESIKSIVTHLKDYGGTSNEFANAITFKAGLWNAFNATECTESYGTWADYVAAKGWNIK